MKVVDLGDLGFDVENIIHISDVHIRNVRRQKEYKIVFDRLFKQCEELVSKNPNTVVFLGGDIVHSKVDLSPESVNLTQYLLRGLCDIAPTFMITGNHDCNLNNASRMDSLTPIVTALGLPNLYYLKDSGVYRINNIDFTVMSVFDHPSTYLDADTTNDRFR
jgi:DNA repair exonuclease SbcCD nuclease subunit